MSSLSPLDRSRTTGATDEDDRGDRLFENQDHPASYAKNPCYREDVKNAGSENFIIAAADTIMKQTNRELISAFFGDTRCPPSSVITKA